MEKKRVSKKGVVQPIMQQHTSRHRYNAVPYPGQRLGGLSKTEPDKGITPQMILDAYQRPRDTEKDFYIPQIAIPVFKNAMDFAEIQLRSEALQAQRQTLAQTLQTKAIADETRKQLEKVKENADKEGVKKVDDAPKKQADLDA